MTSYTKFLTDCVSNRKPARKVAGAAKPSRPRLFQVSEDLRKLAHEASQVHRELMNARQAHKGNTRMLAELDKLDAEAVAETARKAREALKSYAA
ncbi:hypothetical protein [Cupriavidus necator]